MAGGYEWDIFFSYRRQENRRLWIRRVIEILQPALSNALGGRPAKIFIDYDGIETGQKWPSELRRALHRSRVLVPVWDPMYFHSDWCCSEWRTFVRREAIVTGRLIAPLRFHDGEHFPEEARNTQWTDVAPYSNTLPAFWATERALELETLLGSFATTVAGMVNAAPEHSDDWPFVEEKGAALAPIALGHL